MTSEAMAGNEDRYEVPLGLLGLATAVSVTADGLRTSERLPGGTIPWGSISSTRWQDDGSVVVRFAEGPPLRLPAATERLPQLVAAIDQHAQRVSDAMMAEATAPLAVRRALDVRADQPWRPTARARIQYVSGCGWRPALHLGLVAAFLLCGAMLSPALAGLVVLGLVCLGLVGVTTVIALREPLPACPVESDLWIDAEALHWQEGGETQALAWSVVRGGRVAYDNDDGTCSLRLRTARGEVVCRAPANGVAPLLAFLREIGAADDQRYSPAGAQPPSARSLSPARLSADDAERGLSQVERGVEP